MMELIGKIISHYRILEKLGAGGMGVVYRAEDTTLKRKVALKFLPTELTRDPETKERFIQEAQAASALDHQNICTVYECGEMNDGQMFMAMPCYEGETLKDRLGAVGARRQFAPPIDEFIDIALQIVKGLSKTHDKGIVHRDIKPANVFITRDGIVKILDFGLAKLAGSIKRTKTGTTLGTAAYMSPEQARGEPTDQRTDIWSLGVVLYEMLTGSLPFKGEYEQAVIYSILNDKPKPVSAMRSDSPKELDGIVQKALSKRKEQRYQNADEMAAELREVQQEISGHGTAGTKKSKHLWMIVAPLALLALLAGYLLYPKIVPSPVRSKSIAVLPFKNMSDSKEDEYFSDGLTEDIITQLSKIRGIEKVIARTSVMRYKESDKSIRDIAKELGVATVLEGSVRRAGNQVRIAAQLIDARSEGHLWADTYDKEMTQIFAIQSDVAQRIASALKTQLSPDEKEKIEKKQTESTEAYQLCLMGRFYWNKRRGDDLQKAIVYFNQAIEKDQNYALAYAGLASTYKVLSLFTYLPTKETMPKAEEAAKKALELDANLGEAYAVLGAVKSDYYWDFTGSESEFKRAIEIDPSNPTAHYWYSNLLGYLGRFDEAFSEINRAQELDPSSVIINMLVGNVLSLMGQYDRAIDAYQKMLELDPNFPLGRLNLGAVYLKQSKFDEALAEFQNLGDYGLSYLGYTYARMGRRNEAERTISQLLESAPKGYSSSWGIGLIYNGLGDREKTFEWLEKAYEERPYGVVRLKVDQIWDNIRSDPRFNALLKKIGLEK